MRRSRNWIADPNNMLTWRSIVNRVWQYHFGTGHRRHAERLRPHGLASHRIPELLDWLAVWFRDDAQGSLKQLHRLILRSAAYQQQSTQRDGRGQDRCR